MSNDLKTFPEALSCFTHLSDLPQVSPKDMQEDTLHLQVQGDTG